MKPLLIAMGETLPDSPLGQRDGQAELRRVPVFPDAASIDPGRPTVVLLDRALLATVAGDPRRLAAVARVAAIVGHGAVGETVPAVDFPAELLAGYVAGDAPPGAVFVAHSAALRHAHALAAAHEGRVAEQSAREALAELTRAGLALAREREPISLLDTILTQARRITNSDAGSIYLVERGEQRDAGGDEHDAPAVLRFRLAQNHSLPGVGYTSFTVPVDHTSLAGHVALTGTPLVIPDVDLVPDGASYRINRTFDELTGYHTKSVLVIPMKSQRDEIVGVLQLINRKRTADAVLATRTDVARHVLPFDDRAVQHVTALAAQAAVSIENSMLYTSIERLFDGLVTAAATAVEARDPSTYGHSHRVAALAIQLAETIDRGGGVGAYRDTRFTPEQLLELRYAGLLHDFGKVAVREDVLVKAKRLHPSDLERIQARVAYAAAQAELECERTKVAVLRRGTAGELDPTACVAAAAAADTELARRLKELDRVLDVLTTANEARVLDEFTRHALARAAEATYRDAAGAERPLLTERELGYLRIARGNLDEAERAEVEAHVTHTFRFLEQIPWTRELRAVPAIARAHHEKPNGRGYPRGLTAAEIPIASRILAVVDIFDALTASDRPYKPAVPVPRALEIMRSEAIEGGLDLDLVTTFIEARLFEAAVTVPIGPALADPLEHVASLPHDGGYPSPLASRKTSAAL